MLMSASQMLFYCDTGTKSVNAVSRNFVFQKAKNTGIQL
jgi:hypothetical protein